MFVCVCLAQRFEPKSSRPNGAAWPRRAKRHVRAVSINHRLTLANNKDVLLLLLAITLLLCDHDGMMTMMATMMMMAMMMMMAVVVAIVAVA